MNPVIKAQVKDYVRANLLPAETDETQFEVYSIHSTLNGYLGEAVDAYDVHLKGTEFGLDGVAILLQGEVVKNRLEVEDKYESIKNPTVEFIFFQSKSGTSFDYGDISKFFDAIRGFFDGGMKNESPQIDDLIAAKDAIYERGVGKKNPRISCYYLTTGNYEEPKRIESLIENFNQQLDGMNIFDSTGNQIMMVGAKNLQQWYRAATSAVEVEIDFTKNVVMPSNNNVEEAYLGYLPAEELLRLYSLTDDEGNVIGINKSVFFDNIRDYDANSKINVSIKKSVVDDGGSDFAFRNNGITVVSKNIDRTGDRFRLEDYQIVNGCQTSNILFDLRYGTLGVNDNRDIITLEQFGQINVPFRLIGSKDDDFVSSIIVGTNRQNPVKEEQFWALRPFMKNFEEYCKSLDNDEAIYFERRENQYRGQDVERVRIMQPSVMMKALAAAVLFQPHRAARDYRGIILEYEQELFQDEHDVRIYHAICFLYYRLEFLWRNQKLDSKLKTFRYYILAGMGLKLTGGDNVLRMKKNNLHKICDSILKFAKNEDALRNAASTIADIVDKRIVQSGVGSQERVRDMIRSETFAAGFRKEIEGSTITGLPFPTAE